MKKLLFAAIICSLYSFKMHCRCQPPFNLDFRDDHRVIVSTTDQKLFWLESDDELIIFDENYQVIDKFIRSDDGDNSWSNTSEDLFTRSE